MLSVERVIIGALVAVAVLSLQGCTYGARSEISIVRPSGDSVVERADRVIASLRAHQGGCFSANRADYEVTGDQENKKYIVRVLDSTIELHMEVKGGEGRVSATLDEWVQKNYSKQAADCYYMLLKQLALEFGPENLSVVERCEGPCASRPQ